MPKNEVDTDLSVYRAVAERDLGKNIKLCDQSACADVIRALSGADLTERTRAKVGEKCANNDQRWRANRPLVSRPRCQAFSIAPVRGRILARSARVPHERGTGFVR
jgi:hypothetical protein